MTDSFDLSSFVVVVGVVFAVVVVVVVPTVVELGLEPEEVAGPSRSTLFVCRRSRRRGIVSRTRP